MPTGTDAKPKKRVKIIDCGVDELDAGKVYDLSKKDISSDEDIDEN